MQNDKLNPSPVILLIVGLFLFSCTGPNQGVTRSIEPPEISNQRPVIDATPISPAPIVPKKLSPVESSLAPWLRSEFLSALESGGSTQATQGLWMQSKDQVLAAHQASVPLSAASVTKVATTLAAIHRLGPEFRFITRIGSLGPVVNGTLQGDLVITGGDDPLFVWEDAFSVSNLLTELGIQAITGDLIIHGPFVMNFEADPQRSATLFLQSLSSQTWTPEAIAQFKTLPTNTPKPNITLQGQIRWVETIPTDTTWRIQHESLPLVELLKRMNRYSNNPMADQIANTLGGASEVTKIVRSLTNLNPQEINLINGSGLGSENRMTPQGATLMFQALSDLMQSKGLSLGDVLTIVGKDKGILDPRSLPHGLVVKSGTLDQVSALSGVLPTGAQGLVWFTMLNSQGDVEAFRQTQEAILQKMATQWGTQGADVLTPTLDSNQIQTITQRL